MRSLEYKAQKIKGMPPTSKKSQQFKKRKKNNTCACKSMYCRSKGSMSTPLTQLPDYNRSWPALTAFRLTGWILGRVTNRERTYLHSTLFIITVDSIYLIYTCCHKWLSTIVCLLDSVPCWVWWISGLSNERGIRYLYPVRPRPNFIRISKLEHVAVADVAAGIAGRLKWGQMTMI